MRGKQYPELSNLVTKSVLMEVYHQRYEDLDKMPIKDVLFFLRFFEAKEQYKKQLIEQEQKKIKIPRR